MLEYESEFKDIPKLQTLVGTSTDTIRVSDSAEVICVQTKQPVARGNTEDFPIDLTLL